MEAASARIVHFVGSRANIVKAAPLIRALERRKVSQNIIEISGMQRGSMHQESREILGMRESSQILCENSGTIGDRIAGVAHSVNQCLRETTWDIGITYGDIESTMGRCDSTA